MSKVLDTARARLLALASSRSLWLSLASVVIIAVVAFVYFYPDAAQGNVLRQHDTQQGIAIGQEAKAYAEATGEKPLWTGSLFSGMPTFQISPDYPSGRLFGWINTVMGLGLPSPANLLAMMMIGFFILGLALRMRWWVALIAAIGYGFSSYFLIIIGAGHIWKFVTLAYIPPTIAGIVLAYRGRYLAGSALAALFAMMQISSNHVQMTYYFLPVVLGFVIVYAIRDIRANRTARWAKATGALAVAALLAVTANLPSLYNTYEYSKESMRGGHSELTRAVDEASQATAGLDRDYITQYSYQPSETFSLLIPNIKGGASVKPEKGQMTMLTLADLPEAREKAAKGEIGPAEAQYLSYMSQYFGDPEGTNGPVYVGALIFALFLLGVVIVRGPMKWMLVVLTILSIFLAWGRHMMWFTDLFIDYIPMYSRFRTVESILVIAGFTMPLLAAMALQQIFTADAEKLKTYRKPLLWSFGITLAFCMLGVIWPEIYGTPISDNDRLIDSMIAEQLAAEGYDSATAQAFSLQSPSIYAAVTSLRNSLVEADSLRSMLIVIIGLCVIFFYMRRKLSVAVAAVVIGVLICGDLYMADKRYLNHDSFVARRLTVGPPIAMTDADRQILADTAMNYRVFDMGRFDSADPSYYHKMIGGYHAAKLTRYQDLIDAHLRAVAQGQPSEADLNVVNMLNAKYIVTPDGQVLENPEAQGNAWLVSDLKFVDNADNEMAALSAIDLRTTAVADKRFASVLSKPQAAAPGDTIFETSYAPNRLTYKVDTRSGGVAVFSEVYFPWGWHATIDGKPADIARVNYVLRAMNVPAGTHTIEMWFDPESVRVTDIWARVAIILIYVGLAAALGCWLFCRRRDEEEPAASK